MGLEPLRALVGEWTVTVEGIPGGRALFEWALDGSYLIQHSESPPDFPDGLIVIAPAVDGTFLQHYFDSRGVVRLYRMTLGDGVWTLSRTEPDFSPLDFAQRFIGTFAPDGKTIEGRWETSPDGGTRWALDFAMTYTRLT